MITMNSKCPTCGKETKLEMTKDQFAKYKLGLLNVQQIFPDKDVFFREALISGNCEDCTSKLFNIPKLGESWGKYLGECPICGCAVWEKQLEGDTIKCTSCHAKSAVSALD